MLIKVGDIILNSWEMYIKNFKKLWPYMIFLFLPNFILGITGIISLYLDRYATSGIFILSNNLIVLAILAVCVIFTLWAAMALAKNLGNIVNKKTFALYKNTFSLTSHLIWPAIYTFLLLFLIIIGGTLLLIIPGIIFMVWFSFTYLIVIFEEKRGVAALMESKKMVTGRWWAILWRFLGPGIFFAVIYLIISYFLTFIIGLIFSGFTFFVINGIFASILSAVIAPLTALATIILYFKAKEAPVPVNPVIKANK